MKDDNVLKTPQLLTKLRVKNDVTIQREDEEGLPQPLRVHNFSHKDAFGWGFPEVEDVEKKKHVIDMNWLNDYNDEIDRLQIVIKKERSLSFNSKAQTLLEKSQSHQSDVAESELEASFSSVHSFEMEIPVRDLEVSPIIRKQDKSDSLIVQVINEEILSSTPIADVFCSIRNCPSRDSGISAIDDSSDTLPEIHRDRSLLEELEGTGEYEEPEISINQSALSNLELSKGDEQLNESHIESKSLVEVSPGESQHKCPVWYKKFSIGHNDLILNFSSLNWGLEPNFGGEGPTKTAYGKDDAYDSLSSRSDKGSNSSSDDSAFEAESEDSRRRQRLRELWTACDRLEASSLRRGPSLRGVSEVMELVESLSKIDSRLEILKCDLHNLSQQATENRHEFNNLQKRTSNLLTSTETSRHHMAQLFCLEKLKERLHEEWWALHYPSLVTVEDNYIV